MGMTIEKVSTAALKQQLCHYLGMVRQGKEVLVTSHKRIVARLLGEDALGRLPLHEPTLPVSAVAEVGAFGFKGDPLDAMKKDRSAR